MTNKEHEQNADSCALLRNDKKKGKSRFPSGMTNQKQDNDRNKSKGKSRSFPFGFAQGQDDNGCVYADSIAY